MATKTPLVLYNGKPGQLQAGDDLAGTNLGDVSLTNNSGAVANICQAVYASAAGQFTLARANALATTKAIGLVLPTTIANAAAGTIRTSGKFTATTAQWDAQTGQTGGLTVGSDYFLSDVTAGKLTTTAPSSGFVVLVGVGLSATELLLEIQPPIQL